MEFPLYGNPDRVAEFWDEVHARGVAQGKTLAQLLDQRPLELQTGQPLAGALPATINPLEFLLANFFRGNAIAVALRPQSFGADALALSVLRLLRRMLSPYETVLLVAILTATETALTPATEVLTPFTVLATLLEGAANYATQRLLRPTYVDGLCL